MFSMLNQSITLLIFHGVFKLQFFTMLLEKANSPKLIFWSIISPGYRRGFAANKYKQSSFRNGLETLPHPRGKMVRPWLSNWRKISVLIWSMATFESLLLKHEKVEWSGGGLLKGSWRNSLKDQRRPLKNWLDFRFYDFVNFFEQRRLKLQPFTF